MTPAGPAVDRDPHLGHAGRGGPRSDSVDERGPADAHEPAADAGLDAVSVGLAEAVRGRQRQPAHTGLGTDRRGQWMRRPAVRPRPRRQQLVGRIGNLRTAGRQRPGLVEDDHRRPSESLERRAALDDDAAPRRARETRDERDRRCQDQRARRGDDEHGERRDRRAGDEPAEAGNGERDRQEDHGRAIGEASRTRAVGFGLLHEVNDPRVGRRRRRAERDDLHRLPDDARAAADLVARVWRAGRGSPVSAASSSTARSLRSVQSTGTISPARIIRRVAGDAPRPPARRPAGRPHDGAQRPGRVGERGQLAPGAPECALFEQLAAREHERDDQPCLELPSSSDPAMASSAITSAPS